MVYHSTAVFAVLYKILSLDATDKVEWCLPYM